MASKTLFSLSFLLLFSSLHVHGRDSKFFSKLTHVTKPAASPAPAPAEADADGQTGYGLFGHDTETPTEGLAGERQGMSDTRFMDNGKYYYDPSGENTNSGGGAGASFMSTNNNGGGGEMYQGHAATYNSERQGMSDTRFLDNGKYYHDLSNDNTNYNTNQQGETVMSTNNNYEYNTNNNGYANTERQGMSDNGKYYYNPTDDNNEGLGGESLMSNNNGYENTDNYVGGFDTEQEDNNNNERYEFDSMEEYEKYQESKQQGYSP